MPKPKKSNWIVRVRCVVNKDVYCEKCTEDEARTEPFEHATDEQEMDQEDWKVINVSPND